jgi:hypothetical protein
MHAELVSAPHSQFTLRLSCEVLKQVQHDTQ